ncbi:MAG: hypothetical protein ACLP6E_15795 [Acidimicrobiales bacterium]
MSKLKNIKLLRSRLGLAVVAAVAAAVVVGGVSYASIPDGNGLIHGCYKTAASANGTHKLSVINAAVTSKCPSGFTGLSWNADGPNGYSAQTSDTHLGDTLTQVASLTLPAGSFLIDAGSWMANVSPSNTSSLGVCELVFGSATDEVEAGLEGPSSAPLDDQTVAMTVAATVTSSTEATLSCEAVGNSGDTYAETASMTATQIGALNP